MVISKEVLTDFKEVYEKAMKLINEESKNDSPREPYKSHYEACGLLSDLREKLRNCINAQADDEPDDQFTYKMILASVCKDIGTVHIFTEDKTNAEKFLQECIELAEEHRLRPEAIIPYLSGMNEMGFLHSGHNYEQALEQLLKAEKVYGEFEATAEQAMSITDLFGTRDEVELGKGATELGNIFTMCNFFLAQVYGKMGNAEKSANYCYKTLRRQIAAKSFDPIEFTLNVATMSQYYIERGLFWPARHHLAAATKIMADHEKTMLVPGMTEEQRTETLEIFKHRHADVSRCWAKYGLGLLTASEKRLYDDKEEVTKGIEGISLDRQAYRFPELDVDVYEKRVTCDFCLTFSDAKRVYAFVVMCLDEAKEYYRPETEATEYARIVQDYAELYEVMAFFAEDPGDQAKMQKRRAKYLEDLLELLNPEFYLSICRECWHGAGLAYCAILDIKLDCLKANASPSQQEKQKINATCMKAIRNYTSYMKSYADKDGITMKAGISTEEEATVLMTYFYLGRLYYKMMIAEKTALVENLQKSLTFYRLFVQGCDKRKEAAKGLRAEIDVSREMVNLLPLRIANARRGDTHRV